MSTQLFSLDGRLALVTGSSRGIGNALARGLAQAGADVVLHGRDAQLLAAEQADIASATGRTVHTVVFDVTDRAAVAQALETLMGEVGVPDVLVNNAGVQHRAPFGEFPGEEWDRVVTTNLSSAFYVSQPVTRRMAERRSGKVVNIGSVQSMLARRTIAPYAASKGGLVMLTKGMAADLAQYDIQVNAISPGYFASEMNRALWEDPEFDAWVKGRTPAARWGHVDELVGALVFLSSAASQFVSGQNIFVDGGMTSVV
ncbi:SDR family oxidoreductase [Cellulomonas aerilata]|uniref:Gluconate 5-dehydrogenase n=1 Tax=Cellulomonas aerilata TaxID=515326 RepID=A0A512DF69_9CELL|nr:SDR family oxidoreductase [Cellulomonas aerilata]GEO35105.1 gluconate 5-dehydrogenase [Cellulomonas aerilata]